MNLDMSFFTILCRSRKGEMFACERAGIELASRMYVVTDILNGQVADVQAVLESNPAEGWSRDVSEDVARECARIICDNGITELIRDDLRTFIEIHAAGALPVHSFEPARDCA